MTAETVALDQPPAALPRLARNVMVLAGSQVVTWAVTLAWTLYVPRAIGPQGMGELTVALSVTGLVSVLISVGMSTLTIREVAADPAQASWMVGTGTLVRLVLLLPALALIAGYGALGHFGREQQVVLAIFAATLMFQTLTSPVLAALQGLQLMHYFAGSEVLNKAGMSAIGIVLMLAGFGVISLAWLALVLAIGVMALMWRVAGRHFRVDWRTDRERVRRLLVGSLPFWATSIVYNVYLWIDSVILGLLTPAEVVGWYGVPTKIFGTLLFLPVILGTAWLPAISAQVRSGGGGQTAAQVRRMFEIVIAVSLPVAVGIILIAHDVIPLIYGRGFQASIVPMMILGASVPATYVTIIVWQVLVATDRQLAWSKVMLIFTVINPLLNLALIPYFQARHHNGAIGAATALVITEAAMAGVGLYLVRQMLARHITWRIGAAAGASAGMAATVLAVRPLGLGVELGAGILSFLGLAILLRVSSVAEVRGLVAAIRSGGSPA